MRQLLHLYNKTNTQNAKNQKRKSKSFVFFGRSGADAPSLRYAARLRSAPTGLAYGHRFASLTQAMA
jgi:hypothetical protein